MGDDAPIREGNARDLEGKSRRHEETRDDPLREMAELATRVRHEINNPLTGIIGQAQLLLRDETLGEAARRRVEVIEQLAKRIRDVVAELRLVRSPPGGASAAEEPPRH